MAFHINDDEYNGRARVPRVLPAPPARRSGRVLILGCGTAIAIGGAAAAVDDFQPGRELLPGHQAASIIPTAAPLNLKAMQSAVPSYLKLAQASDRSFVVQSNSGESAGAIPLNIKLVGKQDDQYRFVMVRGLPATFKMSAGFRTKDAWLVSVMDFNGLQLIPDDNFVGDLSLQFLLFKGKDSTPEEQTVVVRILPQKGQEALPNNLPTNSTASAPVEPLPGSLASTKSAPPRTEQLAAVPVEPKPEKPAARPAPKRQISADEEATSLQRASDFIQNADIAAARLIYEALAFKGSAQAAFAMGQTYDPEFLGNLPVGGVKADVDRARKWYKKAVDMGSSDAQNRLAVLTGR